MKEPFAWFLDSAALLAILPKEAADKDGMFQRRTFDERKRRDILWDIQRHFAQQAYHLLVSPSARVLAAWEPYVKNFAPNISLDYGGRLMIAWLDK